VDTVAYLIGAYVVVWAFIAGYVVRLAVRQRRLEREVSELQGRGESLEERL